MKKSKKTQQVQSRSKAADLESYIRVKAQRNTFFFLMLSLLGGYVILYNFVGLIGRTARSIYQR